MLMMEQVAQQRRNEVLYHALYSIFRNVVLYTRQCTKDTMEEQPVQSCAIWNAYEQFKYG